MLELGVTHCLAALAAGDTTSVQLANLALDRIADPSGEGARVFRDVFTSTALAEAEASDRRRAAGEPLGRLDGVPVSVKDLFDIAGYVTMAGSVALASDPAAQADAEVVARLRAEGAVIVGRTNMTELAFSGLGLNPHHGTPANPWDRAARRIPGGSSSGAAVSVADGMAAAGIGSDTGGSVRIPAALCGLAGFKPTQGEVSRAGVYPLSPTLDSIGPIAPTIADCVLLHGILSGADVSPATYDTPPGFLVPSNYVTGGIDDTVATAFAAALDRLEAAGVKLDCKTVAAFERLPEMGKIGAYPGIEAFASEKDRLAATPDAFDPRVSARILAAGNLPADAKDRLDAARAVYIAELEAEMQGYDGLLMPTVPTIAPRMEDLADDGAYGTANLLMLRNPTAVNILGGCAASLPLRGADGAPVGLSVAGAAGADAQVLGLALHLADILLH
ncbi:amidase [Psychromarinibacter sp. S121]|uniref:amidase n=1 Tax=Psychromarinibacter sp. S121 TaxID=3415127 RepID=UPI003C7DD25A